MSGFAAQDEPTLPKGRLGDVPPAEVFSKR